MSIEHRGFRITVDVVADEADVQWQCRATVQSIASSTADARLPDVELSIPKLKIDVLMAISMVEHRAVASIDEWHAAHAVAA